MMWVPILTILSLLNSVGIAKVNPNDFTDKVKENKLFSHRDIKGDTGEKDKIEKLYKHRNNKYKKSKMVFKEKYVEDKLKEIYDDYEEYELPDYSRYLKIPKSLEYDYNSDVMYLSKTKGYNKRETPGSQRKGRKLETVVELTIGENQRHENMVAAYNTNAMNKNDQEAKHEYDNEEHISYPKGRYDTNEHSCSGQRCSSLGGNCVEHGNMTCSQDICGKRSFLSPCNCDKDHCCCMPVTCPPESGSYDYQRCAQAGGHCLYKDEICDGECLPLCGPSCTCCMQACTDPGERCGKYGEGSCQLQCDEGNGEMEYPLEICAGPNCRCCGPTKIGGGGRGSGRAHWTIQAKEFCNEEQFGTSCLNGTGTYRKFCEKDEGVIEYITPLCKCCAKEACPLAGSLCAKARGMCKPKCDGNEVEDQDSQCGSGPGCSCCIVKACTEVGKVCLGNMNRTGECAAHCQPDHEPIGLCPEKFGLCLCCAPKVCSVSVGSICPPMRQWGARILVEDYESAHNNNAVCKPQCDVHEKESGTCPGPSCKCCTSPICEEPGKPCSNSHGSCKPSCADNEQIDGTCHGRHCYCCIPKPCDNLWSSCGDEGTCKSQCLPFERSTRGCSGWNCTCCVPMKCVDPMGGCGYDKKGICKDRCDAKEILDISAICKGLDCRCCRERDCHFVGRSCKNGAGKCRAECLRSEEAQEDSTTCTGLRCKCCVLKDCIAPGSPCGMGLAGICEKTCKEGFEDDVGRCDGNNCRCCREKDCRNDGCSCGGKLDGTCKPRCDINEEPITKCEGRDCSCCIKKFCESIDKPCGGNMNGQCKHTCGEPEISLGQCAGLDCKCCALQSCTHPESTCGLSGKGRCRAVCYNSEEVVGTCAGTNCSCCRLKMCADPGSCCNKMSVDGKEISGTCKHKCSEAEEMISRCDGFDCKCCSPMKCRHFGSPCGTKIAKGICKDKCSNEEEVIGKCKGSDCKCCALKVCQSEGAMCKAEGHSQLYGKCMHQCLEMEEEIGICPGAHCRCCASKPCLQYGGPCGNGGSCRDYCLATEEPTGKCKGSHCLCCEPKVCPETGPGGCSPSGGRCERDCTPEEFAPNAKPGSCGTKCHCCICKSNSLKPEPTIEAAASLSKIPPCVHVDGPCGNKGRCRQHCLPLEVSRGKCRGASCVCCEQYKDPFTYAPTEITDEFISKFDDPGSNPSTEITDDVYSKSDVPGSNPSTGVTDDFISKSDVSSYNPSTEINDGFISKSDVPGSNPSTGCNGTCDGGEDHAHGHCTAECPEDHILPGKCPGENCSCCKLHPDPEIKTDTAFSHTSYSSSPESLTGSAISTENYSEGYDSQEYYNYNYNEEYGRHTSEENYITMDGGQDSNQDPSVEP